MDREWELRAACRRQDPDLWFSERTASRATQICLNECPVRAECLEATLAREALTPDTLRAGIMAGLTGSQRAALAAERREAPAQSKPKPKPKPAAARVGRPQSPCGTRAAYQRHLRNGEPVDEACRNANNRSASTYRRSGTTQALASA